jgi:hypothetical protein
MLVCHAQLLKAQAVAWAPRCHFFILVTYWSPAPFFLPSSFCCTFPADGTSWRPGGASLLWLDGALRCLDEDLRGRYGPGAGLVYRRGPAAEALLEVAAAMGAGRVYFSRRYEPAMQVDSCSPPLLLTGEWLSWGLLCR